MSKRFVQGLCLFFGCLIVGLIFAGQLRLLSILNGFDMDFPGILQWEFTRWFLWLVLYPVMLWLIRRYPFQPGAGKKFFLIHTPASIIVSLIHLGLFSIVYWVVLQVAQSITSGNALIDVIRKTEFDPERLFRMIFVIDFHIGIIVYWVLISAHEVVAFSRRASDLRSQLVSAQLEALKMQLHPHFLFNTLNSISTLLHRDAEAADEMIGELGNFLRLTLQARSGHEVSLEQEIRFLESYLEIEKIRFEKRLAVKFLIQPDTLDARVPHLILQPIIENAIRYGIAPRSEPGEINVRSEKRNGHLHLLVMDDGPGLPEQHAEGIGLRNVRERLKCLYGADHHFRLQNRMEGGVIVEMEIPFRINQEDLHV